MTEVTLDDFLTYSSRTKTEYLGKWKDDGSTIIWLSKHIAPKRLWRHNLKRIVDVEDKQTHKVEKQIWGDRPVCLEPEDILKDQNFLNRLTGQRKRPPHSCPTCLFMEYVRGQITTKKIGWLTPVLKYSTDEEEVVITAQGLLGYPKADKLNDDQKRQLKEAGIFLKDGFKEDARAKMNWVFVCVEHNHPEKGLQVAVEGASLGDKVRSQMKKEIEKASIVKKDGSFGNPLIHPYPFKWEYNDAEGVAFGDIYDATALVGTEIPPEIAKLLEEEPPSIENLMRQPDLVALRKNLEEHCLLSNVPWDNLFKPAYDLYKENGWSIGEEQQQASGDSDAQERPTIPSKPSEEIVACDKCQADMLLSETVCKACGFDYDPKPAAPVAPAPAPRKSRSEVSAAKAAPSAPSSKVTVQVDDGFAPTKTDDEIPF